MSADTPSGFDWESGGRELSGSVDKLNSLVVIGSDEEATVQVALGIARAQAKRRPVCVGDLIGNVNSLQSLAPTKDPHGLADVFEYGVSMDKVARRVPNAKNLFVMATGVFVTNQAEVLGNRRWTRIAAGFRDQQGLLILIATVDAVDVEALVVQLDGAVVVGRRSPPRLPVSRVLGTVEGPALPVRFTRTRPRPSRGYMIVTGVSPWRRAAIGGIALSVVAAIFVGWLAYRPFAQSTWAPLWLRGDTTRGMVLPMDSPDDSLSAAAIHLGLLTKADSNSQSPFALSLIMFNTQAGALLELQRNGANLRAGTFTPVLIRETPWYRVVAGAYADSASASALLDTLRSKGMSDASPAVIEKRPFALQVERAVPDTGIANRLAMYQARQLPVYALLQSDGTGRLFAGAFKTKDEAAPLIAIMRAAGIRTTVVYRTGRVY